MYVTGNSLVDKYKKTYATIPEWLYLIDNAEYVVTNSYHCCVFSLKFKKQFGVIPLSGNVSSMNTRLETLFAQWNTKERFIKNCDLSVLEKNYTANLTMRTEFDVEGMMK